MVSFGANLQSRTAAQASRSRNERHERKVDANALSSVAQGWPLACLARVGSARSSGVGLPGAQVPDLYVKALGERLSLMADFGDELLHVG